MSTTFRIAAIIFTAGLMSQPAAATCALVPVLPAIEHCVATGTASDAHCVPVSVYLANSDPAVPAPTILWGHGFGSNRTEAENVTTGEASAADYVRCLQPHGYNVVTMDFRGHGDARPTSTARLHHLQFEIEDVGHVIDWIATKSWAQKTGGDPVLGGAGGSYGGAWQLLAAAIHGQIDAITAEVTWNNLPRSLAPHGAIKHAYLEGIGAIGTSKANLHEDIHAGLAWARATNEFPDGSEPLEPDLLSQFLDSSPSSHAISVPTLLIQGMSDVIFPLNEAVHNFNLARNSGAAVRLVTHLEGHWLPLLQPERPVDTQVCGATMDQIRIWFDLYLKGEYNLYSGSQIEIALDDGECVAGPVAKQLIDGPATPYPVSGPVPGAVVVPQRQADMPQAHAIELMVADGPTLVGGIPKLSGQVALDIDRTGLQLGDRPMVAFLSLHVEDTNGVKRLVNDQVAPLRYTPPFATPTVSFNDVELGGIATCLTDGEKLVLHIENKHEYYDIAYPRDHDDRMILSGLRLSVPTIEGACDQPPFVPGYIVKVIDYTITKINQLVLEAHATGDWALQEVGDSGSYVQRTVMTIQSEADELVSDVYDELPHYEPIEIPYIAVPDTRTWTRQLMAEIERLKPDEDDIHTTIGDIQRELEASEIWDKIPLETEAVRQLRQQILDLLGSITLPRH